MTENKNVMSRLRACLHGGGGPQVGGVTSGGSPHLSCKRDQILILKWDILCTGGLPHLTGLPHLSGVPHLHVNRPLMLYDVLSHSIKPEYSQSESKKLIAAYSEVCTGCVFHEKISAILSVSIEKAKILLTEATLKTILRFRVFAKSVMASHLKTTSLTEMPQKHWTAFLPFSSEYGRSKEDRGEYELYQLTWQL